MNLLACPVDKWLIFKSKVLSQEVKKALMSLRTFEGAWKLLSVFRIDCGLRLILNFTHSGIFSHVWGKQWTCEHFVLYRLLNKAESTLFALPLYFNSAAPNFCPLFLLGGCSLIPVRKSKSLAINFLFRAGNCIMCSYLTLLFPSVLKIRRNSHPSLFLSLLFSFLSLFMCVQKVLLKKKMSMKLRKKLKPILKKIIWCGLNSKLYTQEKIQFMDIYLDPGVFKPWSLVFKLSHTVTIPMGNFWCCNI